MATRAEEKKPFEPPATFEQGSLHLRGFAGVPSSVVVFQVELLPDGTLRVETSAASRKRIQTAQLTKQQTKEVYDAMVKIVSETDRIRLMGTVEKGWNVTARLKIGRAERTLTYADFDSIGEISREFRFIADLIRQELPKLSLSRAALASVPPADTEEVALPEDFEKGSLHISGKAGSREGRSYFDIDLLPDGTLRVDVRPFRGGAARMTSQLTKSQTREFYEAMVKLVGRRPRVSDGRVSHGWAVSAAIKFDEKGMHQEQRLFQEFWQVSDMSPEFEPILSLVNHAMPEIKIRRATGKLSEQANSAFAE
jgi:hypothetical protein